MRTRDQRDHRAGSCRRRRRGSRRSGPPRRRSSRPPAAAAAARRRSSVARPAGELPSSVGMIVTSAVPSRRQSAGAAALRTPSTLRERAGDDVGVAGADERVERRERAGADAGVLQLARGRRVPGPAWASESARGLPSWIVRGGEDERDQDGGRGGCRDPAVADDERAPRPTSHGWRWASRRLRGQSSLGPIVARTTGSSVIGDGDADERDQQAGDADAAQERAPAATSSASSEIATVVPLKTTAEPACCIAFRTAVSFVDARPLPLLAPADDDEERVVDRDPEPDQRDEELDDHGDVGDARERPDQQERRRDRDERHQQRHDRHERAEDEDEDEERAQRAEQRLDAARRCRSARCRRRSRGARRAR